MTEVLEWLSQFGFGAVFAVLMLFVYRSDRRESMQRWQAMSTVTIDAISRNTEALILLREIIESRQR